MTTRIRVSVVIPAYFSHHTVGNCLQALRRQTRPADEVIVVNSSPEQSTGAIITNQFPEVQFIQSPTRLLPHAARNRGIEAATGDLLLSTDPDCIADPAWIASIVDAYQSGHHVLGGAMGLQPGSGWWERGVHLTKFSWCLPGLTDGPHWIAATANAAYSRYAWNAIGPFDANIFYGDALQSWRAAAAGFAPYFLSHAIVSHHHGGSAARFWAERWSRGTEFAIGRARFEHWSAVRAVSHILLTPIRLSLTILRTAGDAFRAGWLGPFFFTLPIQLLGQLGWTLGEARGFWRYAFRSPAAAKDAP